MTRQHSILPFQKQESLLVFSSKLSAQDMIQKVSSTDIIKSAALSLRHAILEESFGLDDKFCDADELSMTNVRAGS